MLARKAKVDDMSKRYNPKDYFGDLGKILPKGEVKKQKRKTMKDKKVEIEIIDNEKVYTHGDLLRELKAQDERHKQVIASFESDTNQKIKRLRHKYEEHIKTMELDRSQSEEYIYRISKEMNEDTNKKNALLIERLNSFEGQLSQVKLDLEVSNFYITNLLARLDRKG